MLKTFAIIKETDKVKTENGWVNASKLWGDPYHQTRLAIIKARNRREAWKIYQPNLSKTYAIDNRSLTAERHNHNKKRRIELVSVVEIQQQKEGIKMTKAQIKKQLKKKHGYFYLDNLTKEENHKRLNTILKGFHQQAKQAFYNN